MPAGVYVLAQGYRRYVGSSRDIEARIEAHRRGEGSAYTRKYPFESVVETILCDESNIGRMGYIEDMYVKIYMTEFGIENVRGGAYCSDVLSNDTVRALEREIISALGRCQNCGGDDHFVGDCPNPRAGWYQRKYTCECCRGYTHTIENCWRAMDEYHAALAEYQARQCRFCGDTACDSVSCEAYAAESDEFYDWAKDNPWIYESCRCCGGLHNTDECAHALS